MTTSCHVCPICNQTALKFCGRCRNVWYCGKNHQKQHWKEHKTKCVGICLSKLIALPKNQSEDYNMENKEKVESSKRKRSSIFEPEPKTTSDVIWIDNEGQEYHVHSTILQYRSIVLQDLDWTSNDKIEIHSEQYPDVLEMFFEWIYNNRLTWKREHITEKSRYLLHYGCDKQYLIRTLKKFFHTISLVQQELEIWHKMAMWLLCPEDPFLEVIKQKLLDTSLRTDPCHFCDSENVWQFRYGFVNMHTVLVKNLKVNDYLEVLDTENKWFLAKIEEDMTWKWKIHYIGWSRKHDEWIDKTSTRLNPVRTHQIAAKQQHGVLLQ